ncbi:MAG: hypothetical protein ACOCZ7_01315, partial [Armatimonadota bacterium]
MKQTTMVRELVPRVALLASLVLALTKVVAAQEAPDFPPPRVAVFPLMDPVDGPDRMVGRRAGASVWAALQQQGMWEIVDAGWLLRLCEAEDVRAPFAVGYLQMLAGHRAKAPLAITGAVDAFKVNPERGVAQVTLTIDLVETQEGTRLASSRGVASAKREEGEVLGQAIDRALDEAGADAVRELTSIDPLMATVVATLPDGR